MQISPIKAFLALLGALAVVTAVVLLTRPETTTAITNSGATESPDYSLTNAEAISRFKELKKLRDRAYYERDLSLAPLIYTSDSNARSTLRAEIEKLRQQDVLDRSKFITESVSVLSNRPTEIVILQEVRAYPRFETEGGEDITEEGSPEVRKVKWVLHLEDSQWLVYRTIIVEARTLRRTR